MNTEANIEMKNLEVVNIVTMNQEINTEMMTDENHRNEKDLQTEEIDVTEM